MTKKKGRTARSRTAARAAEREAEKLFALRTKLSLLEPGGAEENPIEVASASIVELRAESFPCARCGKNTRVTEHESYISRQGQALRLATVTCKACGTSRKLYFRIVPPVLN